MSGPILAVERLTKVIQKRTVVEDISFHLRPGELFGLLGPNGAGKTTILRMIVGLIEPTAGRVKIAGRSIRKDFRQAMRNVGCIVATPPPLYPFLSGQENLEIARTLQPGVPATRIRETARLMGIADRLGDKVSNYSLGMRQRLGLAQAILHQPRLLLLDEPTNGLDPLGIRELRTFLRNLVQEEGTTVLLSTHLLTEAEQLCQRVAMLHEGSLLYLGSTQAPAAEPSVLWHVHPAEQAQEIFLAHPAVSGPPVRITACKWRTSMRLTAIAAVNQTLVEAGIAVHAIQPLETSLEDHFFAKLEEEKHAIARPE